MDVTYELQKRIQEIPERIRDAKTFYTKYQSWLNKYKGGSPVGFACAIAEWESNGQMAAYGDSTLGEVGFFQVATNTPGDYGLSPDIRNSPEGNIFIHFVDFNTEAARLLVRYGQYIQNNTPDLWKFTRAVFAVGPGAVKGLMERAIKAGYLRVGSPNYANMVKFVRDGGAQSAGSQSADKVSFRIQAIEIQWKIGEAVDRPFFGYGGPQIPPNMQGYAARYPKDALTKLGADSGIFTTKNVMIAGALGLGALFLMDDGYELRANPKNKKLKQLQDEDEDTDADDIDE